MQMKHSNRCLIESILALSAFCLLSCSSEEASNNEAKSASNVSEKTSSATPVVGSNEKPSVQAAPDNSVSIAAHKELGDDWRPVGPGGGGHQEFPAISPHEPDLMFVACDMSGFYRSENAGKTWHMDDQVSRVSHSPVFHPTDPNVIYVCTRHAINGVMSIRCGWSFWTSNDRGQTWSRTFTKDYKGFSTNEVSALVLDPDNPSRMWISFLHSGDILTSSDAGNSWDQLSTGAIQGTARLFLGRKQNGAQTLFKHTDARAYKSVDGGATWVDVSPSKAPVIDLSGATINQDGQQTTILYALGKPIETGPKTKGAVWRSTDDGDTWEDLSPQFLAGADPAGRIAWTRRIGVCASNPRTVYVSADAHGARGSWCHGVFKSTDAGESWKYLFPTHAMHDEFRLRKEKAKFDHFKPGWVPLEFTWGWGGNAMHLEVSATDADRLLWTDMGRTISTLDGGKTWQNLYCNRGELGHYGSRGLEAMGGFRVVFDPHHDGRMWIAYNDIGNWRSDDGGLTWRYAMRGAKHRLSMYELRADPDIPDRLYGASSGVHDLPRWRYIARDPKQYKGGFVISHDGGLNWKTQGEGLPEAACTALVLDPKSDQDNRTLYVVAYGHGVYKSVDSGATWTRKVSGMESYLELNEHVFSMEQATDGTLYAAITKRVRGGRGKPLESRGGALFISEDGAESWRPIGPQLPETPSKAKNEFSFLWDVVTSPHDPDEVLVACAMDLHSKTGAPGGVYRSKDRGKTWQRVFEKPRCCRVDYHPTDSTVLFCGADDGLHWSLDAGKTWQPAVGLPFKAEISRANVDPHDPNRIWVTTWGGGVWTGKFR